MKKYSTVIIGICLIFLTTIIASYFVFQNIRTNNSDIAPKDWEGVWVMSRSYDGIKLHNILTITQANAYSFIYELNYEKIYTGSDDKDPTEIISGSDNPDYFIGDLETSAHKITMVYRYNTREKKAVRTLILSSDKQKIVVDENTCPGLSVFAVTPDGCESPPYAGTYIRQ